MGQISSQVEEFIEKKPLIKQNLSNGLINYSALARKIQEELGIKKNFQAVLIAVRRKAAKLIKQKKETELKTIDILKKSSLEIKTKILVVTLSRDAINKITELTKTLYDENADFQIIQGTKHVSLVVEEKYEKIIEQKLKYYFLKTKKDLVEVIVKSPSEIEEIPGVVSTILNEIFENGINLVEAISCYTDTILILNEKDLSKTVSILDRLLK